MASRFSRWVAGSTLVITVLTTSAIGAYGSQSIHTVKAGDTLWKLSQRYHITQEQLHKLNPQLISASSLNIGDKITVPAITHTVKKGDTPWTISNRYGVDLNGFLSLNGLTKNCEIYPGQVLAVPTSSASVKVNEIQAAANGNKKTFKTHTVVKGDDLWKISIQYGIPFQELLSVNGLKESHVIKIGDKLTIPVYEIAVKSTPGSQYGELLDWWTEAQYVIPIGKEFTVVDFVTGKRWKMKRTIGANHADCEPLTSSDAAIMKQVWGGSYSWNTRAVIIEVDNRKIAASASSMPHDIQYITNNSFTGHSDLHFFNSTRHKDGLVDTSHQAKILKAAGK